MTTIPTSMIENKADKRLDKPLSVPEYPNGTLDLELISVTDETLDVKTFVFEIHSFNKGLFRIHPGQAIRIAIELPLKERTNTQDKEVHYRTFTVCDFYHSPQRHCPDDDRQQRVGKQYFLALTVKKLPNGLVTQYMHSTMPLGSKTKAYGPFGQFSVVYHPYSPLLLVGAGSGLTPIMSMLRWLHRRKEQANVVFIQHASTPNDLLFSKEIAEISINLPNISVIESVSNVPPGQFWNGVRGRLNRKSLSVLVPDLNRRTLLCCGPQGFIESMYAIYKAEGGDPKRFYTETFGSADTSIDTSNYKAPDTKASSTEEGVYHIAFEQYEFIGTQSDTLLNSAANNGIRIPASCKSGSCGTCKIKLESGNVSMAHSGGLSNKEEQNGFILACCSKPKSNLVLSKI